MIINDITAADRDEFIAMETDFYNSPAVLHEVKRENFVKTFDRLMVGSPFVRCLFFRDENSGAVLGYALLAFSYSNEAGGDVVWVDELYVKSEYRSTGIANRFFDFLSNEYKNFARFRLETEPDNDGAKRLYKRMGFEPLGYSQMIKDRLT